MPSASNALFRKLPSVDELLRLPALSKLAAREGVPAMTSAARSVLGRLRDEIENGNLDAAQLELAITGIASAVERELASQVSTSLRAVVNATGVILHTNLGRAPLADSVLSHIAATAGGYTNLEFDLATGERGKRDVHSARLFDRLLAPFAKYDARTIVVNNCAAAVLLALNTLAEGGDVIVSRGELVEIGGSFRVPEIMAKSGAKLREVGTTNRTRISDYEKAITENTRLLLRVHRSNFAMVGFTEQPSSQELVALGRKHRIPVMEDLGNGLLVNLAAAGIHSEHGLHESLAAGIDVVCMSGDKLLGGPQAGIVAGRKELVKRIRANPLFRALRVDKLTYAALEATLLAYVRQDVAAIPALRMIYASAEDVRSRAESFVLRLGKLPGMEIEVVEGRSLIGGGAAPDATLPTFLIAVSSDRCSPDELQSSLRAQAPPVIARIEDDRLVLDLRTVFVEEEETLLNVFRKAVTSQAEG